MSPESKYGNYNYSNYWEDVKDVDPKDANWEYVNPLEEYPDNRAEEEILEDLRIKKQLLNDVWQSTLIRDVQGGVTFVGSYELFAPRKNAQGSFGISRLQTGSSTSCLTAGALNATTGVDISVTETYTSSSASSDEAASRALSALLRETKSHFYSSEFRTEGGNQIVGSSFTLTRVEKDLYVTEVGIREGMLRIRVRFAYHQLQNGTSISTSQILSGHEISTGLYDYELLGFLVIREAVSGASPIEMKPLFSNELGSDLYDPQVEGEPYVVLKFPPSLTILYPRGITHDSSSVLTIQWDGQQGMRYQVDRKIQHLRGGIKTLELTEIRTEDISAFPPTFKPVELLK